MQWRNKRAESVNQEKKQAVYALRYSEDDNATSAATTAAAAGTATAAAVTATRPFGGQTAKLKCNGKKRKIG